MDASSRKRKDSITNIDYTASKRPLLELSDLRQDESNQDLPDKVDKFHQTRQYKNNFHQQLIGLMYQLQMSAVCSIRTIMHKPEYHLMSIAIDDFEIDKFSDIVIRYNNNSVRIHVEYEENCYTQNSINYAVLFAKKGHFAVNKYFNSYVKYEVFKADNLQNKVKYLIIHTNSGLDLTEDMKLNQNQSRNFYPFQFHKIDLEKRYVLKDILYTSDPTKEHNFYQFAQEEDTRIELLKQLELSAVMQRIIKERGLSEKYECKIKKRFLKKLVFAVHQPNREELKCIIKHEIENISNDYVEVQEQILKNFTASRKIRTAIIYELTLLLFTLHDMFLYQQISFARFNSNGLANTISVSYKNEITYIKAYNANIRISYSHLFPPRHQKENIFSINKHFALFLEELVKNEDIKFIIIYTNANLDLEEDNRLKTDGSQDYYPLKFEILDTEKKRCKVLKYCSYIKKNSVYQFAKEERTTLLSLLKLPPFVQKKNRKLFYKCEKEVKEKFLEKLIIATNQLNMNEVNDMIKKNITESDVPYTHEEIHEVALRWLESYEFKCITEKVMRELLDDIKNNRSSCQKPQSQNISEEFKLAKSVTRKEGSPSFNHFLWYLTKGEGKICLESMDSIGINLVNISSILHRTGSRGPEALMDLHNLWFDKEGNPTFYLKTLQENETNLASFSSVLNRSRFNAVIAFVNFFHLWFDEEGNKTQYLKNLEKEKTCLSNISKIFSGAGLQAPKVFKDLYDLWFDKEGNRTQYLITLKENGVSLFSMSNILSGASSDSATAFTLLYKLWFDEDGNKTQYLKTLDTHGINLGILTMILYGAGFNAVIAFKDLYNLWFNEEGNKTLYLEVLESNEIDLVIVCEILAKANCRAAEAFKNLFDLWFDEERNKTKYLQELEKNGISILDMSKFLNSAGRNAAEAFKNLYDLWFDNQGNKTPYLKCLEMNGIKITVMSSILYKTGISAVKSYKSLCDLWFDKEGNQTHYTKNLQDNGIKLSSMSITLHRAGNKAAKNFLELYNLWFDEQGNSFIQAYFESYNNNIQ